MILIEDLHCDWLCCNMINDMDILPARATGEAKTLEAVVERARLLMTLDDQAYEAVVWKEQVMWSSLRSRLGS